MSYLQNITLRPFFVLYISYFYSHTQEAIPYSQGKMIFPFELTHLNSLMLKNLLLWRGFYLIYQTFLYSLLSPRKI